MFGLQEFIIQWKTFGFVEFFFLSVTNFLI